MTTNNPPIAAWAPSTALHKLESRHNNAPCILTDGPAEFNDVALVRLDAYEALQAERDQQYDMKVKAREQRDEVTTKLSTLYAECEKLRKDAERYRWLRADNAYFPEENYIRVGQELDAAITAAIQEDNQCQT